jgi:toxin ParE1/3/4
MARRVFFRPAAERDLTALYAYIRDANGGPEVAIGYVRRIRSSGEGLAPFPERGVARQDLRPRLPKGPRPAYIAIHRGGWAVRPGQVGSKHRFEPKTPGKPKTRGALDSTITRTGTAVPAAWAHGTQCGTEMGRMTPWLS